MNRSSHEPSLSRPQYFAQMAMIDSAGRQFEATTYASKVTGERPAPLETPFTQ